MRHFSRDLSSLGDDPVHDDAHPLSDDYVVENCIDPNQNCDSIRIEALKNVPHSSCNFDSTLPRNRRKLLAIYADAPGSAHPIDRDLDSKCADGTRKKKQVPPKNVSYLNREFDLWCTAEDDPRKGFDVDRNGAALKSVHRLNRNFDSRGADDSRKKCGAALKKTLAVNCANEQEKKNDATLSHSKRVDSLNRDLPVKCADRPERRLKAVIPKNVSLTRDPRSSRDLPENGSWRHNVRDHLMPPSKLAEPKYIIPPTITDLTGGNVLDESMKYSDEDRRFDNPPGSTNSGRHLDRFELSDSDTGLKSPSRLTDESGYGFKSSSSKSTGKTRIQNDAPKKEDDKLNAVHSDAFLNELKRRYYEPLPSHSQAQDDYDGLLI